MNIFLDTVRHKPEDFVFASKELSTSSVAAISELFNQSNVLARSSGHTASVLGPASRKHKLVTKGFDSTQIYEQLRSHCEPFIDYLENQSSVLDDPTSASVSSNEALVSANGVVGEISDNEEESEEDDELLEGDVSSDSENDDASPPSGEQSTSSQSQTSSNRSKTDDVTLEDKEIKTQEDVEQYVTEMDKFSAELDKMMEQEDDLREKLRKREENADEDSDSDDMSDDDELSRERRDRQVRREEEEMGQGFQELELQLQGSDDSSSGQGKSGDQISFEDFFGPRPKSASSKPVDSSESTNGSATNSTSSKFETEIDKDSEDDDSDEESDANDDWGQLSSFARKQRKMAKHITELEDKIGADRSWELMGEASAKERPDNSLLETFLDFESNVKPPPVITEEFTKNLEDIITERIINEQFDDVERKLDPEENKKRKRIEVDVSNEKSEIGLGDLYAKQYIQEITGGPSEEEEKLDKEHAEIAQMYASLCYQLDSLSNFHFTPKPPREEMQVRTVNAPAIAMEEAIPLGVSTGTLMAPEEVYKKKGELVGETEKDTDERRKNRRTKKRKRRKARQVDASNRKARERQQDAAAEDSGNSKSRKKGLSQSNLDVLNELAKKQKRAKTSGNDIPMDSTKYTSSADVFSKLQNSRHNPAPTSKAAFRGVGVDEKTRASNFKL